MQNAAGRTSGHAHRRDVPENDHRRESDDRRLLGAVVLVFIAALIAAGIAPAVQRVRLQCRFWFHRNIPRGAAVLLVYVPFLVVMLLLATVVVPRLLSEAKTLGMEFPALVQKNVTEPLERYFPMIDLS